MFITLEGGDGVGKSTQARMLADALRRAGHDVLLTREPGGTPGAEALRQIILSPKHVWSDLASTFLHFAARAEHVADAIRPALAAGACVVCDRFADSTVAYQGYGEGIDLGTIATLTAMIGLRPDLTLVLVADPATSAARIALRPPRDDRYEELGAAFNRRIDQGFRSIVAAEPDRCVLIDANGTPDEVHATIWAAATARLPAP